MEKGLLLDNVKLPNCSCRSPQCAHCSFHEALRGNSIDNQQLTTTQMADGDVDEDSDILLHALSGTTRSKLNLPCRGDFRSLSSSLAFPSRDRLISKRWPPLPLKRALSVDSVVYADARADLEKSEKKLLDIPSMLTITSSSIEVEQEILSTQPQPSLEQQYSSLKKSTTRPLSSSHGSTNPATRICRYCNREFPSGRALGGHMRVHGGVDADSFPPTKRSTPEWQQLDKSTHRSSSPLANSKPENRFAEVNCLVISGSKSMQNPCSGEEGVLGRRINSEESMVRGASADGRKSVLISRGLIGEEHIPIWRPAERNSVPSHKNEQFVKQMKDQPVVKGALKREMVSPASQKSIAIYANVEFNEKPVNANGEEEAAAAEDDDDNELYNSKLMVLGNVIEAPLQGNTMESFASECIVDEENPPHKLRPNPRPSRRRLWPDRDGVATDINARESSSRWPSSLSTLRSPPAPNQVPAEHARPCSECGKVFPSCKALFGHMRCHPEREWRGIQRPDANTSELDNRQANRACKSKFSSLSLVEGNAELEMELESDAENRAEACKLTTLAISSVSASAKLEAERFYTQEEVAEIKLTKGVNGIKDAEGLQQKAEDCSIKGGTKRALKSRVFEQSADDDLAPSAWPTRKRSRRSRAKGGGSMVLQKVISSTSAEPALTSETVTSSELRDVEKVSMKELQEDLDMANCLVLLSSSGMRAQGSERHYMPESTQESALKKHGLGTANFGHSRHVHKVGEGSGDGADNGANDEDDEEEAENFAAFSYKHSNGGSGTAMKYECSTCKRCFKSHQALGGHRASHRKTKGCFALMNQNAEDDETMQESKEDNIADVDDLISSELNHRQAMGTPSLHHQHADEDKFPFMLSPSTANERASLPTASFSNKKKKFKGHACSICHRIFPSGQALGGHKRCHWTGEKIADSGSMASSSNNNNRAFLQEETAEQGGDGNEGNKGHQGKRLGKEDGIDLNLPAPMDEEDEAGYIDNAGLSSTDAMEPNVQNGVEENEELEGEEDNGEQLVDYIGGKKRSLNGLSGEWIVGDGRRQRSESPW